MKRYYDSRIYSVATSPEKEVAIVFGAAVRRNRLTTVLRDRMDTAIALYKAGKVGQIIVSGDGVTPNYDEPGTMMAYAVQRGVPAADIVPDFAGLRTYDTCYRARQLFEVKSAVLVTQTFHLPRALFTCGSMGVDVVGVSADQRTYRASEWYETRETAATVVALWDILRAKPATILTLTASG